MKIYQKIHSLKHLSSKLLVLLLHLFSINIYSVFDKDEDGFLTIFELKRIMTSMGCRMSRQEFDDMISEVDSDDDGLVNYKGK